MLDKDIQLACQSISMVDGHAGYEIRYIAATREVKEHSYSVRVRKRKLPLLKDKTESTNHEDTLSIPETITTERELREYISRNRPWWMINM